jgi:hypothetical protein
MSIAPKYKRRRRQKKKKTLSNGNFLLQFFVLEKLKEFIEN